MKMLSTIILLFVCLGTSFAVPLLNLLGFLGSTVSKHSILSFYHSTLVFSLHVMWTVIAPAVNTAIMVIVLPRSTNGSTLETISGFKLELVREGGSRPLLDSGSEYEPRQILFCQIICHLISISNIIHKFSSHSRMFVCVDVNSLLPTNLKACAFSRNVISSCDMCMTLHSPISQYHSVLLQPNQDHSV